MIKTVTFHTQPHEGIIKIPERYRHLEAEDVEVTITLKPSSPPPSPENSKKPDKPSQNARGILNKYKNPSLIPEEKKAWEKAVKEKYANR